MMSLDQRRVELSAKGLIACRHCHAPADISIFNSSPIKLICPRCHVTLGSWTTAELAVAEIAAFVSAKQ
jgi:uncharacterized paraquat-inducible protein A